MGLIWVVIQPVYGDSSDSWKILIKSVGISNSTYWPSELQAKKLEAVEWENRDSIAHTVTSGIPSHANYTGKIFDSGLIKPTGKFTFKLPDDSWSAYYYFCKIHPWMTGKIDATTPYLGVSPVLTIRTDKSTYYNNDILRISGHINDTNQFTPMTVQIFDQHRNLVFLKIFDSTKSDKYSYEIGTLNMILTKSGDYKIKTLYGFPSVVTDANFAFVSERKNNNTIQISIPAWIKNNAKWWAEGKLGDSDFINGMQYLIKNEIIQIHGNQMISNNNSHTIPQWVKNNVSLWSEGKISDNDFVIAMTYLIQQGIIVL